MAAGAGKRKAMSTDRNREKWTREEHLLAFNLYCKIPFGTIHHRNPRLIELAELLGRTPSSVSFKLSNFARTDPALQARGIAGLTHGAKGEEDIWRAFGEDAEAVAFESERLLAQRREKPLEVSADIDDRDLPADGKERESVVRVRVNQSFFRSRILSAYDYRCCVTGLAVPELLVASHIRPWSMDRANRLNPRNGLCLNALHDRAFDRGLMWITDDYTVRFRPMAGRTDDLARDALEWLTRFEGKRLILPGKFSPDVAFLRWHAKHVAC